MRTLAILLAALAPVPPQEPWGSNRHPTDAAKEHVEVIDAARHAYGVRQTGTLDGTNCRSPVGVGMSDGPPLEQTWESNRAVRMENAGETDVVNPWLSNGRNTFRTLDEIVASAVTPGMSDRDKAFALWFQQARTRYHWAGDNAELGDPVKVFNVYGHNTCGNDSISLAGLWRRAGLKAAPARLVGHCVSQAFFDGRWNLFDGDMHSMYLLRDNRTIAGEQDLVRDHDLVRRSHTQGILNPDSRATDEWQSSIYVHEGEVSGDRNCAGGTTMNMVLRPGEAITWRWGRLNPVKVHGTNPPKNPDLIANGLWEYRPDFSTDAWRNGATAVEGLRSEGGALAAEPGKSGSITWAIRSPYVLVGGRLEVEGSGAAFAVSFDGKSWEDSGTELDRFFPPGGPARYEVRIRCRLEGGAMLRRLGIVHDLQMAPMALPGMEIGENRFVYTDSSPGPRKVRIRHEWVERSASRAPAAPPAPLFPPDRGDAHGTDITFQWTPPADPDGDRIADYHFELSEREDMRWPLSTNFYKLLSKTADRGKARYRVPHAGLLAPDRLYHWRVRAKDEKGVWGPWSATWSFTPRAPAPPVDVTLDLDPNRATALLRWKPNPEGNRPVAYRVYGSDEKGFTVSDEPYKATVGVSKELPPTFPANFAAETRATEVAVAGTDANLPNANRAFYRVVAVDERGNRSGASEYVASPRPFVFTRPVTNAKVGAEYRYPLSSIRSLGDLRMRVVDGRQTMGFWDIEAPAFAVEKGPAWLKIDARTGILSGVPDGAGRVPVTVTATIDREARKLDERQLGWGVEKVLSTSSQRVGVAGQSFVIEIAP